MSIGRRLLTSVCLPVAVCAMCSVIGHAAGKTPPPPKKVTPKPIVIERTAGIFEGFQRCGLVIRISGGKNLVLDTSWPSPLLFHERTWAVGEQFPFKRGDPVVIYHRKWAGSDFLVILTDPQSEVLVEEMRVEPPLVELVAYDAKKGAIKARANGRVRTYRLVAQPIIFCKNGLARLQRTDYKDQVNFGPGDKVLLIMTKDGGRVRMVMDTVSYNNFRFGLQRPQPQPQPPAAKPRRK